MKPDLPLLKIGNLSTWLDTQNAVLRAIAAGIALGSIFTTFFPILATWCHHP